MERQKTGKGKKLIALILLAAAVGFSFGYGVVKAIKRSNENLDALTTSLEKHCDCESIGLNFSSVGLHISKKDGVGTGITSYTLKNCNVETLAFSQEVTRIKNRLEEDGINVDALELCFEQREEKQCFKLATDNKNGNHDI